MIMGLITMALVRQVGVVEADVSVDSAPQFQPVLVGVQIDVLVLDTVPESLEVNVVRGSPATVHAHPDSRIVSFLPDQRANEHLAG